MGHAGTLDPLATGVLVICVGHATRLINLVQDGRKRYRGRFLLGSQSDTDDISGNVRACGDWSGVTVEQLSSLLEKFVGRIAQVPPQYSAIHVKGGRAYEFARRGESIELKPRMVDVFSIRVTDFCLPEFELEIECGSGTYVRSIGRDVGRLIGCGAVMTELKRLAVGAFDISFAVPPTDLSRTTIIQHLQPALTVVSTDPRRTLTTDEMIAVRCGRTISGRDELLQCLKNPIEPESEATRVAMIDPAGQLLGIGELNSKTRMIQPRIVFPADSRH